MNRVVYINTEPFEGMSRDLLSDTHCVKCRAIMKGIKPVNGYHNPHRHLCFECEDDD